jgi:parallel beta-helix repeat protein
MAKNRTISTGVALVLGLGLLLALLWALGSRFPAVRAQGPDGHCIYYVAPSCSGLPTPCYTTVQAAVDAADHPDDVIKVAAGTYTGVNNYGGLSQVVYINKTVTIQGGYTTAFTDPPDPDAYPTTLDAGRQGRVIYITRDIKPTLEGLRIVQGLTTGNGGGIYASNAHATISGCQVLGNRAYANGGGLSMYYSDPVLTGNTFIDNIANSGSGLFLYSSDNATVTANILTRNYGDVLLL